MPASRRLRRAILGSLFALVVTAVGLELGSRALARVQGEAWDPDAQRAEVQSICDVLARRAFLPGGHQDEDRARASPSAAILQPYTAWEHLRTQTAYADQLDQYRDADAEAAYDVCVLGGSVAQTFAQVGADRLRERLGDDPRMRGRPIRVHDDACAGTKQPQALETLVYLLAMGHAPDAVIELDGFNEAALGWTNAQNGANPAYPFLPNWARAAQGLDLDPEVLEDLYRVLAEQAEASRFGERLLASGTLESAFLGRLGRSRLETLRRRWVDAFRIYTDRLKEQPREIGTKGPPFDTDDESVLRAIVTTWEESSVSLGGMCATRDITYLHVLQPALPDPGTKPLTEKEVEGGTADPLWIDGVHRLYPRFREAGPHLRERGIAFLDATGVFRDHPEDVYVDVCHFAEHGNEILADAVAAALLEAEGR